MRWQKKVRPSRWMCWMVRKVRQTLSWGVGCPVSIWERTECPKYILVKITCSLRMSKERIDQGMVESWKEPSLLMRRILPGWADRWFEAWSGGGNVRKENSLDPSLVAISAKVLPGELQCEGINANEMLCSAELSKWTILLANACWKR